MPRRIALIVGVSKYEPCTGLHNLSAPVNDAQRVYEVLAKYGGFDELYPLPLANGKVDGSGWVTAQELRAKLHEVLNPQLADEVELAVFYFSGHGVNPDGQVAYLSASDKPWAVAISHIAKLAKHSAVKNLCIWLDCCHSGEMLEFSDLTDKGFCVVAASHADGEALAAEGNSLLTNLLCEALTPLNGNPPEIRVMDFIQTIEANGKNLPQQVICLARGNTAFTLTQFHGETTVTSAYPPDYPPYKGLLTFTKDDSPFFFGRDGMIQQLLDKLSASRFVPLLGASGSGKSSLVLAGLLPKLPDSDWQVLVMRLTAQPLQNLRDTLVRGFPDAQVGTLASSADLQREVLRLVMAGKRLLLVIDQFEEVFTECRDNVARAAFFACLLEALDSDNPLYLVLTLRADFLGHCTEQAYSGLGQRLQYHALLLVAPTAGELREAITRPLALVGMRCEQALEDELVDQTLHAKGSLPLLQYVLEKLWQSARQERSRELTLAIYQQLGGQHGGGLRGVLNEKADAFYQQLEPQQQRLMEWLMVELVQVNEGQEDTRRTVTLEELHNRQPQYTAALDVLLVQLVTNERLLTQDHDDHGQATITVAHEALIRDWQRLRGWLESNHEIKSWRMKNENIIYEWRIRGYGLLREEQLAIANELIRRNFNSLLIGANEVSFIEASNEKQRNDLESRVIEKLIWHILTIRKSKTQDRSSINLLLLLAIQAYRLRKNSSITNEALFSTLQHIEHSRKYIKHSLLTLPDCYFSYFDIDKLIFIAKEKNVIKKQVLENSILSNKEFILAESIKKSEHLQIHRIGEWYLLPVVEKNNLTLVKISSDLERVYYQAIHCMRNFNPRIDIDPGIFLICAHKSRAIIRYFGRIKGSETFDKSSIFSKINTFYITKNNKFIFLPDIFQTRMPIMHSLGMSKTGTVIGGVHLREDTLYMYKIFFGFRFFGNEIYLPHKGEKIENVIFSKKHNMLITSGGDRFIRFWQIKEYFIRIKLVEINNIAINDADIKKIAFNETILNAIDSNGYIYKWDLHIFMDTINGKYLVNIRLDYQLFLENLVNNQFNRPLS